MSIDRDRLRKLCEGASRGPWTATGQYVSADSGRDGIAGHCTNADAEFIAATRQAIPELLDALDAAEYARDNVMVTARKAKTQTAYWQTLAQERLDRAEDCLMRALRATTDLQATEARLQAVQDLLDTADQGHRPVIETWDLRDALDR